MGPFARSVQDLVHAAADAGVDRPWELLNLSPREIELQLQAHHARLQRSLEQADLQAWLTGRYVLAALHAPRRYPRRPDGVFKRRSSMNDEEMKRVFRAFAQQRRE